MDFKLYVDPSRFRNYNIYLKCKKPSNPPMIKTNSLLPRKKHTKVFKIERVRKERKQTMQRDNQYYFNKMDGNLMRSAQDDTKGEY